MSGSFRAWARVAVYTLPYAGIRLADVGVSASAHFPGARDRRISGHVADHLPFPGQEIPGSSAWLRRSADLDHSCVAGRGGRSEYGGLSGLCWVGD